MLRLEMNFENGDWSLENPQGQHSFYTPDGVPTEWFHLKVALSKVRRSIQERPARGYNIYVEGSQVSATRLGDWNKDILPPVPLLDQVRSLEAQLFGYRVEGQQRTLRDNNGKSGTPGTPGTPVGPKLRLRISDGEQRD